MIKTILDWLSGSEGASWISVLVVCVVAAIVFAFGYGVAAHSYEAKIAELYADFQAAAAAQAKINQKEAETNAIKLAEAISARDEALARAGTLDGTVARLREQASSYERRLSAADADSCKSCKAELARCVRLLSEGAGLAGEGADLSVRIAADKDAIVKISTGH